MITPFTGIPKYRSTVKPTGEIPLSQLKTAAEAAAMKLRHMTFGKGPRK